jgi:hypothetical protein
VAMKRKAAGDVPSQPNPEIRNPEIPDDKSLSEIDPKDPAGSAQKRFLSADGATGDESGVTSITVTWGGEKFSPIQYHTVDIGPFSITLEVKPDELVNQVYHRGYDMLDRYARQTWERKLRDHIERVKQCATASDRAKEG